MMIYIYDILLNFCDNDLLYDFYEWDKNDNIENIKRIKLVHVDKDTLNRMLEYDGTIDDNFLIKIFRTCEIYSDKKVKVMDYCALFSDGERVIAIEFDKDGNSIYKSKLLLDEEEEIALLASNLESTVINYNSKNRILTDRFFTRNEIVIRNYLIKEIEDSYKNKKYGKLKYLYQEYFDKDSSSYKNIKNELLDSVKNNIDSKHLELFNLLKLSSKKKQV